jgi:excisionase family DNA binding protein
MAVGRLFRIEEAAALRGESYGATRAAIARGELRAVRVGARGVRIPESELSRSSARERKREKEPEASIETDPGRGTPR